jgi:peptidoglycan/LPS O-acetylase OafA/YrhL
MQRLKYRPEIDGLRAIAVLAVILFHAQLGPFPGGFLGVDVFFVISGYLITRIITPDIDAGRFNLKTFYMRRVRRILPALYLVTLLCLPVGLYLLIPEDLADLAKSAIAAVLFVPNFYFWDTADYFARAADFKPLIHTWSLGVEEQFYLLFPALLLLLTARARVAVLAAIIAVSIGLSIAFQPRDADAVFYLLPFRAWELATGALAAVLEPRILERLRGAAVREAGGLLGLLLLIAAIVTPAEMLPPIVPQLVAILGAVLALLLWRQGIAAARLLGSAPLAGIGLISYSAYLWHQPILAYARSVTGLELDTSAKVLAVLLTLGLSYLSWRFIETPFRDRHAVLARRLFGMLLPVWAAIVLGALAILFVARSPDAMMTPLQKQVFLTAAESPERKACHIKQGKYVAPGEACVFNARPAKVAVLGNSHGVELAYALGEVLAPEGVAQFTYSACPPLYGQDDGKRSACARWTADVMDHLLHDSEIDTVVIAYSMTSLADGIAEDEQNEPVKREVRRKALFDTIDGLTAAGKTVVVVLQAPRLPRHVQYDIREIASPADTDFMASVATAAWTAKLAVLKAELLAAAAAATPSRLLVVDPADIFCPGADCAAVLHGEALFFDDHHMSVSGARLVAAAIKARLAAP